MRQRIAHRRLALVGLIALFGAPAVARPATEGEAVVEARLIEARLNASRGLVGRFTQTLDSPALPGPQEEKGTFYLLRPGRMRWEYEQPPGKLAIADGHRTYLYLPDDRQVVIAPMPEEGNDPGAAFLLRTDIDLLGEFRVGWGDRSAPDGRRSLVLTPKIAGKGFDQLILEIAQDHMIEAMTIVDPLGSTITYRFTDLRQVGDLDAALFRFEPPAGTDVQEVEP